MSARITHQSIEILTDLGPLLSYLRATQQSIEVLYGAPVIDISAAWTDDDDSWLTDIVVAPLNTIVIEWIEQDDSWAIDGIVSPLNTIVIEFTEQEDDWLIGVFVSLLNTIGIEWIEQDDNWNINVKAGNSLLLRWTEQDDTWILTGIVEIATVPIVPPPYPCISEKPGFKITVTIRDQHWQLCRTFCPNVIGMTRIDAVRAITNTGLIVGEIIGSGVVVRQNPLGMTHSLFGDVVTLKLE